MVAVGTYVISDLGENRQVLFRAREAETEAATNLDDDTINQIDAAASQDILNQVVSDLQARKPVLVNQSAIDLAFNPQGGHGGQY